jgi:WD40 repeat protein
MAWSEKKMTKSEMRFGRTFWLCLCLVLAGCTGSVKRAEDAPEQVINWRGEGIAFGSWGAAGNAIYATSVKPAVLDVWDWSKGGLWKRYSVPVSEDITSLAILPNERWIGRIHDKPGNRTEFCVGNLATGAEIDRWPEPQDVYIDLGQSSRNGKFVPAWSSPEVRSAKYPSSGSMARVGMVASDGESIEWITVVTSELRTPPHATIHRVVASEDGAHVGIAGWDKGLAMIDVAKKKVLWVASPNYQQGTDEKSEKVVWKTLPLDEVNAWDFAFSPDGKLAYEGGDSSCVQAINVATGKVVSRWWATRSGKKETGCGITTISVSPDGRFVAAGTGPEGLVFLFSTKTGRSRLLNHGGSQIMMTNFSPDSKHLVSYTGGKIKLWAVSEPVEEPRDEKP